MKIRKILKYTLWLLPLLVAVVLYLVLPHFPNVAEWVFARGIFRVVNTVLTYITGILPFSLTELVVVLAIPACITLIVLLIRRLCRKEGRGRFIRRTALTLGWILSCTALLYMLTHGCNFYRYSTARLMEMDTATCTPDYLQEVVIDLAKKASAARLEVQTDENGCMQLSESTFSTLWEAEAGFDVLAEEYAFLDGSTFCAKSVQLSHWWSYTGISGMYFPLFGESNVNTDQVDCYIPVTAAHEIAHTRGFAREDECNFYAYLSCTVHPSADYRYSGYLFAYVLCANALYDYDVELWRETRDFLSEGARADLAAHSEYWKQFEGPVEEVSTSVNNGFLTSQGQEEGVLSYGEAVRLIVGYYRQQGLVPENG